MPKVIADSFTKKDIEKLRKDTLTILKAVEKESSYEEAMQIKQAIIKFEDFLDKLFYKKMAPLIENETANKAFRKATWDFYINLSLPLEMPDEYYTKERRYSQWLNQKEKWLNAIKRKARVAWKAIDEYFLQGEDKEIDTSKPLQISLHGFNVIFEDKPTRANYDAIDHTLELVQKAISNVFPKALQRKPTLIFVKQEHIDMGGEYSLYERKFILNLYQFSKYLKNVREPARIIAHELAHDIYQNYLSKEAITYWKTAIRGDYGDLKLSEIINNWPEHMKGKSLYYLGQSLVDKDPILALKIQTLTLYRNVDFRNKEDALNALKNEDITYKLPKHPITPYAGKNAEEGFCEAFANYAINGSRAVLPQVRYWLKTVLTEATISTSQLKLITALKQIIARSL